MCSPARCSRCGRTPRTGHLTGGLVALQQLIDDDGGTDALDAQN
jgi:hypothetical protein